MAKVQANTGATVLEKYWLTIVLLFLIVVSMLSSYFAVVAALVFTFLIPGIIAYRFFPLKKHEVWAFIPLFSVIVSVTLVYYLSLIAGYSPQTVLLSFLVITAFYAFVVYKKGEPLKPQSIQKIKHIKKTSLLLFTIIFLVSSAVLFRSVWSGNTFGIVMTGSNWQDTPLHYEIIQSLNNGNFPPQMPNFAGEKLTYHYFVDFHTAIVENMYGYLPTLLPFLNAVFIVLFALCVYALARSFGRRAAVMAVVLAVFGWGFSYLGLFSALFNGTFSASTNYIYQYGDMFGLPSIFDNLLQQRPLLVGLPAFAFVLALLRGMDDKNRILLAGIITGLIFQFHNIAFFCCSVAFAASMLINFKRLNLNFLYFLVPAVLALPFILVDGPPASVALSASWIANFAQNPLLYYLANLGIPLVLAGLSFFKSGNEELKLTFLFLMLIPNIFLLTPNVWDMYKFFIFAWVPIAVLSGVVLAKLKWRMVAVALVLLSIITSSSVIIYNVGTNFPAASWSEYEPGLWVKDNTPQGSVFLTYPSIHAPPSFIGGRLRVSSYVNWAYGHGTPLEDIQKREQDINKAYTGTEADLQEVIRLYNISYVYVGPEETRKYPDCITRFNSVEWLEPIYADGNLRVYQVQLVNAATG